MAKSYGDPTVLVLQSPYTSFRALAADFVPVVGNLAMQRWDTTDSLQKVGCPILLIHGTEDEIIPFEHSQKLYSGRYDYRGICTLHVQQDATHNDFDLQKDVIGPMKTVLKKRYTG